MTPPPPLLALSPGPWVVGVSGGADSVALLRLVLEFRPDITPIVAHFDHLTRAGQSTRDAEFVRDLVTRDCTSATCRCHSREGNSTTEAALRKERFQFFARAVRETNSQGVLLAHHADDRAETVLLRLVRGGEPWAIDGLRERSIIHHTPVHRPLLFVRKQLLVDYLASIRQPFVFDQSNDTHASARNVARVLIRDTPGLFEKLLDLANAAANLRQRLQKAIVQRGNLATKTIADATPINARWTIRRWLALGAVEAEQSQVAIILSMCVDASGPRVLQVSPRVRVVRKRGELILLTEA